MLQTGHQTIEALRQLRGVGVALDDFGTGCSSLVFLEQLPLSRIKLDGSQIESIDTSTRSQAISRAIIAHCQSLGLEITAGGVERREQLSWLLGHPTTFLQGCLLSRPEPAAHLLPVITGIPARMRSLLQSRSPSIVRRGCDGSAETSASAVAQDGDDDATRRSKTGAGRRTRQFDRE